MKRLAMFVALLSTCTLSLVPTHDAVQKTNAATSSEGQILWRFDSGG